MKRRDFLHRFALGLAAPGLLAATPAIQQKKGQHGMRAGFARVSITPPVGTTMMGFGTRDMDHGCEGVHDDIYVRALFVEQGAEQALIMAFDLCFLGREEADRFKGAIGRTMDLLPRQILMNTSHNHVGPAVGTWYSAGYTCPDRAYLDALERATVRAAHEARAAVRDATLWAGVTTSALPMNRRRRNEHGEIENRPNPGGQVYDKLPVCLIRDGAGRPLCLLFSVSAHSSMMTGFQISAEYPGAAMHALDTQLGATVSLFLQGVGGDAKPAVIGRGVDRWQPGTWALMEEAGQMVAQEVAQTLDNGLAPVTPDLCCASEEMVWRLEAPPTRAELEAVIEGAPSEERSRSVRCMWAARLIERLEKGNALPDSVTLTLHGIKLGDGLRVVGIEGEAVAGWGYIIEGFFDGGVTFPLGYTDGTGLYLPTSMMLPEGGYEVVSYWEYGYPAPLARGMEGTVLAALERLRARGIT